MQATNILSRAHALDLRQFYAIKLPKVSDLDLRFTCREMRWLKSLFYVFLAEVGIMAFLIIPSVQMYLTPNRVQASTVASIPVSRAHPSGATLNLIDTLSHNGWQAEATIDVMRPGITGPGVMIVISNTDASTSSLQVFTANSSAEAQAEASALAQKYTGWRVSSLVHVYVKDTLVGVYVGNSKDTLTTLDIAFDVPQTGATSAATKI